ncbi:methionyl-tRNA formyltransferase [Salmonella enterica]|nr:methionyl-tRNA formyltransferase [Salmonella enterica]EDQ4123564.1 methionyl-tRNA formyltransferase [Salmonella enterica subsp. enterica serovar Sandiego]EGJ4124604.1 methionyl-tRNA formyltransferase [Salmonella enterica]EGM4617345.1 methionyl-tRNA formyltransferase [Salmonella enterica]
MPSTDWYFRHDNVEGCSTKSTVYQLAAWALTNEGDIVGLVTVRDIETGRPKLVTPPPVAGDYLHREQLEADEVLASKRR